jgi:hypothetical protein
MSKLTALFMQEELKQLQEDLDDEFGVLIEVCEEKEKSLHDLVELYRSDILMMVTKIQLYKRILSRAGDEMELTN